MRKHLDRLIRKDVLYDILPEYKLNGIYIDKWSDALDDISFERLLREREAYYMVRLEYAKVYTEWFGEVPFKYACEKTRFCSRRGAITAAKNICSSLRAIRTTTDIIVPVPIIVVEKRSTTLLHRNKIEGSYKLKSLNPQLRKE